MSPKSVFWRVVSLLWWRRRLGNLGKGSVLFAPLLVSYPKSIFIGEKVCIRDGARLEIVRNPVANWDARLVIGSRVNIEQGAHIVCQSRVVIEDDVSITPYCVIVDTYHPHDPPDIGEKIGARLPDRATSVRIGQGTFIGAHSVILPDVEIGRGCVIGAGSVVSHSLPDYCVAAGSPARVLKIYDPATRQWSKVNRFSADNLA
ncbi:acyltransferase [Paraburkholderia caffeinilytica]|uniref:acyltransferase n=1 Tax=Paraburkholderia caffeinilytica TaxID=1761016 RepID=UPI0038BC1041